MVSGNLDVVGNGIINPGQAEAVVGFVDHEVEKPIADSITLLYVLDFIELGDAFDPEVIPKQFQRNQVVALCYMFGYLEQALVPNLVIAHIQVDQSQLLLKRPGNADRPKIPSSVVVHYQALQPACIGFQVVGYVLTGFVSDFVAAYVQHPQDLVLHQLVQDNLKSVIDQPKFS